MTYWLILTIAGHMTMSWGPTSLPECEARKMAQQIDKPMGHEYECMRGKRKWTEAVSNGNQ